MSLRPSRSFPPVARGATARAPADGAWSLRARIPEDGPGRGFWRKFRPGRWYAAEADGEQVRLLNGRRSAAFDRAEVEIRSVPDDHWEIRSASRAAQEKEGQSIDYPTRVAECPEGHVRPVPTRFDQAIVELRCRECSRSYRLVSRDGPDPAPRLP